MDDFKAMAKVLAAIKAGEDSEVFNLALISERALGITEKQRDKTALLLHKNGYIEGLHIIDGIDGQRIPVICWNASSPSITLDGLKYIEECKPLKKAFAALRELSADVAAQVITNQINRLGM